MLDRVVEVRYHVSIKADLLTTMFQICTFTLCFTGEMTVVVH